MNESLQAAYSGSGVLVEQRNRVLRNTYWLLALSMIPTVIGAWIGVSTGFSFFAGSPFISLIAFLAIAFAFMYGINRYKDSSIGIVLLLGIHLLHGADAVAADRRRARPQQWRRG